MIFFFTPIGYQIYVHFYLIGVVIGLISLLILYIFHSIIYNNKDLILKRFNNKYVVLYLKYHLLWSKIFIYVLPFLILIGLIDLFVGLHFFFNNSSYSV